MKHCPNCAAPFDGLVPFCWHCGHDAKAPVPPVPPERTASDPLPTTADAAPSVHHVTERSSDAETTRADVAIAANPAGRRLSRWALAFAGVLAGLATILVIGRRGIATTAPRLHRPSPSPAASNNVPAPLPADPEPTIESAPPPTWVGAKRATLARDGSKTIAFELAASNDVGVWMKRVQPLLVVRCLSRTTEVFVATGSAASIEPQAGSHTVHIQFDAAEPVAEPWSDSGEQPGAVCTGWRGTRPPPGAGSHHAVWLHALQFSASRRQVRRERLRPARRSRCRHLRLARGRFPPCGKTSGCAQLNASPRDQPTSRPSVLPCSRPAPDTTDAEGLELDRLSAVRRTRRQTAVRTPGAP